MKNKEQRYFRNEDSVFCETLEDLLSDAKLEGLTEITLIEAIPANNAYVWCMHEGEVADRDMCKKSECRFYESKSGRGKCKHRGNFYNFGTDVTFDLTNHPNG